MTGRDPARQARRRQLLIRVLVVSSLSLGANYIVWRWLFSVNWDAWWIALPLIVAETYALIDTFFFGVTMWRARDRGAAPPPATTATVDVFITTYNEPIDMVMETALAARSIRHPHQTWILDDGSREELRERAQNAGLGYLTRSAEWLNRPRHAKAGNLNNALFHTFGEFILILDADQIPEPEILDHTLGYFNDPQVALVQTPQWFSNVDEADPLGSQAPLFYGPIQQGKDGWNAAFFCGSNAILRREALMQLGVVGYVRDIERSVRSALRTADKVLVKAGRSARAEVGPDLERAVNDVRAAVRQADRELRDGEVIGEVTYRFQRRVDEAAETVVRRDFAEIQADLAAIGELPIQVDDALGEFVIDEGALEQLANREWTPLGALESVRTLARTIDVDRHAEAQPLMPMATISVTEDMATAMRLHALGWRSVYHHEILARGLAPEDLATMLTQRLRWAQGTLQVLLRENPLAQAGLSWGQKLMYFATMWSYLSGFTAVVFIAAPIIYLCFGVMPVAAWSVDFFTRFIPYFLANQLFFVVISRGVKTWRGQQYSLALFPIWIRACVTAFNNVVLGRPLGFAVTPKTRPDGRMPFPFRLIWPQLTAIVLLIIAAIAGAVRLAIGQADGTGVVVNLAWIGYDLIVLSIIIRAGLYQGPRSLVEKENT